MKKIIIALLSALIVGGILFMAEQSYAFCGSKCKHPTYTKENFEIVEYKLTTTTENQRLNNYSVKYPEGFNKDNTFVLTPRYSDGKDWYVTYVTAFGSSNYTGTIDCYLTDAGIVFSGRLPYMEVGTEVTLQFLLMKIDI